MYKETGPFTSLDLPLLNSESCEAPLTGNELNDFKSYLSTVQTKLDCYDASMRASQENFDNMVHTLTQLINSSSSHPPSSSGNTTSHPLMTPNTSSPHTLPRQPPCTPYIRYEKNVLSEPLSTSLQTFIQNNRDSFVNIGGCRDTLYFGEYEYRYSGGRHDAKDMPAPLNDLMEHCRSYLSNPDAKMNSCLVTRYKSGTDHIPQHRDDEPVFDPNSEILTVSMGSNRVIKFTDNTGANTEHLTLEDKSVFVMSRSSQSFWLHEIEKDDNPCQERISFTFRNISPHFLNSTVIIGDSNTQYLQFGEGKGCFGKWLPGKRIPAMHIEDIPDAHMIGPYRNIVIHAEINNVKSRNCRSSQELGKILETKCKNIMEAYPNSKIHLSLALPTKLESLNFRVKELNCVLQDLAYSYKNVSVIQHPFAQLCNSNGSLRDDCGRFDKESGTPLARDALHLGKKGLRLFASSIKTSIVGKFKKQTAGASAVQGDHVGERPP